MCNKLKAKQKLILLNCVYTGFNSLNQKQTQIKHPQTKEIVAIHT